MPFFEDIGKKITNMSQSAIEKTKCSTETLRLNNQIREEQHLCKGLYQQIGQQYAQQYEANPDPAFEPLMKQLHDAQKRIASYQEQIQIKKLRLPSQLFLLLTIVVQYAVHRFRQILNSVQLVEQK